MSYLTNLESRGFPLFFVEKNKITNEFVNYILSIEDIENTLNECNRNINNLNIVLYGLPNPQEIEKHCKKFNKNKK